VGVSLCLCVCVCVGVFVSMCVCRLFVTFQLWLNLSIVTKHGVKYLALESIPEPYFHINYGQK
jgi:hypothetical protein